MQIGTLTSLKVFEGIAAADWAFAAIAMVLGYGILTGVLRLALMPAMVKQVVEASGKTRFDRAHFKQFGASSLDFEVVYFVLSPDYNLYMDLQQDINLALMHAFLKADIRFAIPASVQYFTQAPAPPEVASALH